MMDSYVIQDGMSPNPDNSLADDCDSARRRTPWSN